MGERELNRPFLRGNQNAQLAYEKMLFSYEERKSKPQQNISAYLPDSPPPNKSIIAINLYWDFLKIIFKNKSPTCKQESK